MLKNIKLSIFSFNPKMLKIIQKLRILLASEKIAKVKNIVVSIFSSYSDKKVSVLTSLRFNLICVA